MRGSRFPSFFSCRGGGGGGDIDVVAVLKFSLLCANILVTVHKCSRYRAQMFSLPCANVLVTVRKLSLPCANSRCAYPYFQIFVRENVVYF